MVMRRECLRGSLEDAKRARVAFRFGTATATSARGESEQAGNIPLLRCGPNLAWNEPQASLQNDITQLPHALTQQLAATDSEDDGHREHQRGSGFGSWLST